MKHGQWHVLHSAGIGKGHVSKSAKAESKIILRVIEGRKESKSTSDYNDIWVDDAA